MAPFLSPAWLADLDRAARASEALSALGAQGDLVIQQAVTGGPDGDVVWHLAVRAGQASVAAGPAPDATVTFTTDRRTAEAVHLGEEAASSAFVGGRLRIGGDVQALLRRRDALAALDDVLASARAGTTA